MTEKGLHYMRQYVTLAAMKKLISKNYPAMLVTFPAFSSNNAPTVDSAFNYLALVLNRGMYWLATFAFLFAGIMIIISGIKFMFAGGDEEKRKDAKHTFIFSIIGVVVVILAQNFITVIRNFFGV